MEITNLDSLVTYRGRGQGQGHGKVKLKKTFEKGVFEGGEHESGLSIDVSRSGSRSGHGEVKQKNRSKMLKISI